MRVDASAEEQQGLVERCLAAELEVERLQGQLTQLRRKLDDSMAALHELGRENQNLQVCGGLGEGGRGEQRKEERRAWQ